MNHVEILRGNYGVLRPFLGERERRRWAATEVRVLGRGGVSLVPQATGLSRNTIHRALREIAVMIDEGSSGSYKSISDERATRTSPTATYRAAGRRNRHYRAQSRLAAVFSPALSLGGHLPLALGHQLLQGSDVVRAGLPMAG